MARRLIGLWLLGAITLNLSVSLLLWHAHEVLFGFAVAVIVGFLLTAGKAWTGLATPRGGFLAALALLWLAARVAAVLAPYAVYAALPALKPRTPPWLEQITLAATALAFALWVLLPPHACTADSLGAAPRLCLDPGRLAAAGMGAGWRG